MKEIFDRAIALLGLLFLSPLFFIVALLIKEESRGPVFYRGRRVGKGGEEFLIYKFRSMIANSTKRDITIRGDPRITRFGRFLRCAKIDELPQLINVLRGEMSLVGPRPESPRYVKHYTEEERKVLTVKPGITGLVQLSYRDEEQWLPEKNSERFYLTEVLSKKLKIDLEYIRSHSFWGDLKILIRTLFNIVS